MIDEGRKGSFTHMHTSAKVAQDREVHYTCPIFIFFMRFATSLVSSSSEKVESDDDDDDEDDGAANSSFLLRGRNWLGISCWMTAGRWILPSFSKIAWTLLVCHTWEILGRNPFFVWISVEVDYAIRRGCMSYGKQFA